MLRYGSNHHNEIKVRISTSTRAFENQKKNLRLCQEDNVSCKLKQANTEHTFVCEGVIDSLLQIYNES